MYRKQRYVSIKRSTELETNKNILAIFACVYVYVCVYPYKTKHA